MKKSSSLESLQTMVQGVQMTDCKTKQSNVRVVRGRGCDDSFRAAVDKNGPLSLHELQMQTCLYLTAKLMHIAYHIVNENLLTQILHF